MVLEKSLRKHLTIAVENPEYFDFPKRMEEKYGNTEKNLRFFRKNMKAQDILDLSKVPFEKALDDATKYEQFDIDGNDLDISNGCSESCEVF